MRIISLIIAFTLYASHAIADSGRIEVGEVTQIGPFDLLLKECLYEYCVIIIKKGKDLVADERFLYNRIYTFKIDGSDTYFVVKTSDADHVVNHSGLWADISFSKWPVHDSEAK